MQEQIYDYIIIGAGIAGTYAYHRLQQINKNFKIILFEKNNYIGGRMKDQDFHGTLVKLGAGIVDETCEHILNLLKILQVKTSTFKSRLIDTYLPKFEINNAIILVTNKYEEQIKKLKTVKRLNLTVDQFLRQHFDSEFVRLFYLYGDYTDFHYQDINDFINNYPIDDLSRTEEETFTVFKYGNLFDKLKENKNIMLNYEVTSIQRTKINDKKVFIINDSFKTYNLLTATTADCLKKLLNYDFLNEIKSIPFCRNFIYSDDLSKFQHGVTLTNNELKKIIKLNDNVLMVVYCDNDHAKFWKVIHEYDKHKPGLQINVIKKLLKENDCNLDTNIKDLLHHYWPEGIHYYMPQDKFDRKTWVIKNMHPEDNVFICGEMLTIKQGWMEGAVQSVDLLFDNYF